MLWQRGLVEREINELLRGLAQGDEERNKSIRRRQSKVMSIKMRFFALFLRRLDHTRKKYSFIV